ncbi:hypothetical protein QKW52_25820 [Bacillus sonorensis]|nr:hypothetical protein [Bacillus sonorensis]
MNPFPTRSEKSFLADVMLRHREYDIFLFIEDEKMRPVYNKIVERLVNGKLKIGKVYSLRSKKNVLEMFGKWKAEKSSLNKCFLL